MSISLILSLYSSTDSHVTLIHTIHHPLQICLSLKQSKKTGYRLMSGYLRQHFPSASDLPKLGIKPPHSGGVISSGSLTPIITCLLKPPASLIGLLTCSNKEPKSACMEFILSRFLIFFLAQFCFLFESLQVATDLNTFLSFNTCLP